MTSDLFERVTGELGSLIDGCYDTKLPDEYVLAGPVVVFSEVDESPTAAIDSTIVVTDQRVQFSILAQDLDDARAVKAALKTALNGWRGDEAGMLMYESGGPVLYYSEMNPPSYQVSADFMVML